MEDTMTKDKKRIFHPGMYYVVDSDNTVTFSSTNINDCKAYALDDEMILICLPASSKKTTSNVINLPKAVTKAKKIIVDFVKNLLTIEGDSVTLDKVEYAAGEYPVDFKNWVELVKECNKKAEAVEFVGTPPIDGKDITNEMSDL